MHRKSTEKYAYKDSKMIRYTVATKEPIYPIGFVQTRHPMCKKNTVCSYTSEGREGIHKNLRINTNLMIQLMRNTQTNQSIEFNDNKISLFSAQWGKCGVTDIEFQNTTDIHCYHKVPKEFGGDDGYCNLILVLEPVHKLIHAVDHDAIQKYMKILKLTPEQFGKINELRILAKRAEIIIDTAK